MPCAHCEAEFTPKRTTGRFCSTKYRAAAWQENKAQELTRIESDLEQALIRVRGLRQRRAQR
jgi:hypothetical protein